MTNEDLFIFEMANNHQGSLSHGKKIIDMCARLSQEFELKESAIKFQFRDLDSFIHPDKRDKDIPYVKRFLSTQLSVAEFSELVTYAKELGLKTCATLFDEKSINLFKSLRIDFLKIASCSIDDYPLLEELSKLETPTIVSTGGASEEMIERALFTLKKEDSELGILHCVGLYPTEDQDLQLQQIRRLKELFPGAKIGYSTHEHPNHFNPIIAAKALGAQIFEKHVAVETNDIAKNKYSANEEELKTWLSSYKQTLKYFEKERLKEVRENENLALSRLKRGIFKDKDQRSFYAFPKDEEGEDVSSLFLKDKERDPEEMIFLETYIQNSLVLRDAGLNPQRANKITLSFPKGLAHFEKYGAQYFEIYEDDHFLRKWIVLRKGQQLPLHRHDDRKELLTVLKGSCLIEGERRGEFHQGHSFSFSTGEQHSIEAVSDVVIEETITKLSPKLGPSAYSDESIERDEAERKIYYQVKEGRVLERI